MPEKVGEVYVDINLRDGVFDKKMAKARGTMKGLGNDARNLEAQMKAASVRAQVFGDKTGGLAEKQNILKNKMNDLINKGVSPSNKGFKKLNKQYTALEKQNNKLSKSTGKYTFALAALGAGLYKSIKFFSESIDVAIEAEETYNKFSVVFKDVDKEATKAATNLAKNFGLARGESQKLLSDTGDLLTGFGFTGEAALDISTKLNELAVDLASFTNVEGGATRASRALTSALLGETEQAKSLGIVIRQADVQNRLAQKGNRISKETGSCTGDFINCTRTE